MLQGDRGATDLTSTCGNTSGSSKQQWQQQRAVAAHPVKVFLNEASHKEAC
jgi:hypothetical protein